MQEASRVVGDGLIGDVQAVHLELGAGWRRLEGWRADPDLAGLGTVHNVGVHGLDFLRVILHSEPVEVTAMFDRSDTVERLAVILLRFGNGAIVTCNCNESVPHPLNDIKIYGSKGRIWGTGFTRSRSDGDLAVLTERGESVTHFPAPDAHRRSVAAFTSAVLRGEEPNPSGLDGVRSAQVCEAIALSAREGRLVEVDDRLPGR